MEDLVQSLFSLLSLSPFSQVPPWELAVFGLDEGDLGLGWVRLLFGGLLGVSSRFVDQDLGRLVWGQGSESLGLRAFSCSLRVVFVRVLRYLEAQGLHF